jgi:hypothetical protein
MRHARYQGLDKAHVQNVLTGMALNITRLGAHYAHGQDTEDAHHKPRPVRPPTRVHRLCRDLGLTSRPTAA